MQPKCPNERSKGGKVHHFGCVTVALRLDTFILILKNQSERQSIELVFKVQISPDRTLSNTN